MNNRVALFAQAARGPVLLITIGALFVVHQAGILPFSRTWPLILIVVGLMKLVERINAPAVPFSPPQQPPPPQQGGPR